MVFKPGLARQVNPGPGRPEPGIGSDLSKNPPENWPYKTRSIRRVNPEPSRDSA